MKLKQLLAAAAVILAGTCFTACTDSDSTGDQLYTNIVTYKGTQDGLMMFDFQGLNDSPVISLRGNAFSNANVLDLNTRFFAAFTVPAGTELADGLRVNIVQAVKVPNLTVVLNETKPADFFGTRSLYATQLVRSGHWLNLSARIPALTEETANDIKFKLVADPATLDKENVELYLVYENSASEASSNNYDYFVTFNIQPVMSLPNMRRITVYVNSSNSDFLSEKEFSGFQK